MIEIEDFYVITDGGLCIYAKTRKAEQETNRDLLAGFMSAIQTFARQMDTAGVDAFTLGTTKFLFLKASNLFFVAKVPVAAKDKEVRKELQELQDIFFLHATPDILAGKWKGNLKDLAGLEENFSKILWEPT